MDSDFTGNKARNIYILLQVYLRKGEKES